MIRINLLGTSKSKNRRPGAPPAPAIEIGDVGSPMVKVLVAIALTIAINGFTWFRLNRQAQDIGAKMKVAEQTNLELSGVKAKYLERQKEADNYKRRVDVIDQLRKNQTGPTELLNMIGDTINGTEAVWLNSMKDEGNSVDIQGMALSHDAVASLIGNLQKTGRFRNVEIKETFQDSSIKEMQAFQFTLTCEKGKS